METETATTEGRSKTVAAAVSPAEHADLIFAASAMGKPLSEALREHSITVLLEKAVEFRRRLAA